MKLSSALTGLAVALIVTVAAMAQEPSPLGEEFQVNTYTTNRQRQPEVAMAPGGEFVVVWNSWDYPGSSYDTWQVAQRYDATGTPLGGEIQVQDSMGCCDGFTQAVAMGADGHFAVVWGEDLGDPSVEIRARLFDELGDPLTEEFSVNTFTSSNQIHPKVSMGHAGNFVVVWDSIGSYGSDTFQYSIQAQRYEPDGAPVGGEFQVNSYTTFNQWLPAVASDTEGDFVVVWASDGSYGSDTSDYSIQAQRHDADGTPAGVQFQVNSYTTGHQWGPAVAADAQGNFVVIWDSDGSYGTDSNGHSIQGQRYNAAGNPIGGQFQVNTYTPGYQVLPGVAADSQGDFVVVWQSDSSYDTDTSFQSIQAQVYDLDGTPVGGQFQVNSYTTDQQKFPAVAADAHGKLVVVWASDGSYGTDSSGTSVQGQRFSVGTIFAHGFESGDFGDWGVFPPPVP